MHYLLLTGIAIILWSSLAALAGLVSHLPPFYLLALSLLIGGSLSIAKWRAWRLKPGLLLIGVVGIFGYHFLLFMALRLAPAVLANLLNYLWPLLILLMTPLYFPAMKLTKFHLVGVLIAFFGAFILITNGTTQWSMDYGLGYILALLAAIVWANYSLASKKVASFSSATVGLFCLLSGGLSLIAHALLEPTVTLSSQDLLIIVCLGVGPLGIAFYCWDGAIKNGDPRMIATLSYFTPLLSTLLLMLTSDQAFTMQILIAIIAIVGGAVVANFPSLIKR